MNILQVSSFTQQLLSFGHCRKHKKEKKVAKTILTCSVITSLSDFILMKNLDVKINKIFFNFLFFLEFLFGKEFYG